MDLQVHGQSACQTESNTLAHNIPSATVDLKRTNPFAHKLCVEATYWTTSVTQPLTQRQYKQSNATGIPSY